MTRPIAPTAASIAEFHANKDSPDFAIGAFSALIDHALAKTIIHPEHARMMFRLLTTLERHTPDRSNAVPGAIDRDMRVCGLEPWKD